MPSARTYGDLVVLGIEVLVVGEEEEKDDEDEEEEVDMKRTERVERTTVLEKEKERVADERRSKVASVRG